MTPRCGWSRRRRRGAAAADGRAARPGAALVAGRRDTRLPPIARTRRQAAGVAALCAADARWRGAASDRRAAARAVCDLVAGWNEDRVHERADTGRPAVETASRRARATCGSSRAPHTDRTASASPSRRAGWRSGSCSARPGAPRPMRLTDGAFDAENASWIPDGSGLYFTSSQVDDPAFESPDTDLYRVNVAGGPLTRIASIDGIIGRPVFSPDGARVTFRGTLNSKPVRSYNQPDLFVADTTPGSHAPQSDGPLRLRRRRRPDRRPAGAARFAAVGSDLDRRRRRRARHDDGEGHPESAARRRRDGPGDARDPRDAGDRGVYGVERRDNASCSWRRRRPASASWKASTRQPGHARRSRM